MKKGWQIKTLGEICSFLNRGISPRYLDRGGICVLNQKCIRDHRVSYEPSRRHDARAKKVGSERLVQAGDVLVNSTGTGTLGRVAQLREAPHEPTIVDSHVTIVRPTPGKFYPDFFGYMLVVIEDAIKEAGEGCGGQTELARSALAEKFLVHYPESLPEQQRIAGILDEAFEGLATAKANAEKNLQNARALFESHLQAVFSQRGDSPIVPIRDVAEVFDGPHATPITVNAGPVFLGIGALQDGQINLGETRHVTPEDFRRWTRRVKPQADDVVFSYETRLGQAAIIPEGFECCLGRRMGLVRVNRKRVDPRFFVYQYISPTFRKFLDSKTVRGATVDRIALKEFPSFPISLPSLAEQERMTNRLDALREETQRLEFIYQQKLVALDELKKSLLHQGFTGQL